MKVQVKAFTACVITLALVSCGGGGDSSPSLSTDTADDIGTVVDDDETPAISDESDSELQASASDPICTSHTPTNMSTEGNNVFVFEADIGQCFGYKEALGAGKRLIPIELVEESLNGFDAVLSIEPEGRLTVDPKEGSLGDSISYSFNIDVTNTGAQTVCIPVLNTTARILNAEEDLLGYFSVFIAGDNFQTVDSSGVATFNTCIPPGESRIAYAKGPGYDSEIDAVTIASYDRIEWFVQVLTLDEAAVAAPDLTPVELNWTSYAQAEGRFSNHYTATVSVQNLSSSDVESTGSVGNLVYLDSDNYVVDVDKVFIGEFLGKDDEDLTVEDRTIDPLGGTLGFSSRDRFLLDVEPRADGFRGSANRAFLHFSRCFDTGCN